MKFTVVPTAKQYPQRCVALPQLGSNQAKGYFDTGNSTTGRDIRGYVSVRWVEMAAEYLGYLSPETQKAKDDRIIQLEMLLRDREEELKSADKQLEAINTLRSERWRPVSKPGPRPKKRGEDE